MKAEQLRKAILQMAIQGKLVPQNPNDEPASVLLEKIRAEKQKIIKEGKIKKDKVDSVIFRGEDNRHYEKIGDNEPVCIEDELPFEIPESWEWVRLGNAYNIVMGQSPNGNSVGKNCNGIEFHQGKICFGKKYLQVSEQKTTMPTKIIKEDAVVLCVRAPVGKVNIVERMICIGRGLCAVMPFISTSIEFIYLLLQTYEDIFNKKATGTTFKAISNEVVFNQIIPLPPLAEQERIVAEIEKYEPLIAEYDKLEQQKNKLDGEIYDKLKKSILQYAIQGKLVPQDERDEPASELLKRIRAEKKAQLGKKYVDSYIYKGDDNCYYEKIGAEVKNITEEIPFDIPENWEWIRLGTLFQHNTGKALNSSNKKGIKREYITTSNLYWGCFKLDNLREMLFTYDETEKYSVNKGDLLVCEGGDIGRAAIWNYDYSMCIQNHIHKLHPYYSVNIYFYYCIFYVYKSNGLIGGRGIGIQGLSSNVLDRLFIPLPPMQEQNHIIETINILISKLKDDV